MKIFINFKAQHKENYMEETKENLGIEAIVVNLGETILLFCKIQYKAFIDLSPNKILARNIA